MLRTIRGFAAVLVALAAVSAVRAEDSVDQQTMGYWVGQYKHSDDGPGGKLEVKLMALGDSKFEGLFIVHTGPDDKFTVAATAERNGDELKGIVKTDGGDTPFKCTFKDGKFTGTYEGPSAKGTMSFAKTACKSPNEGAKPPADAIVLFDGKNLDAFQAAHGGGPVKWIVRDGVFTVPTRQQGGGGDIISKHKFTDAKVHVEFRTPYMPKARGQGRGNSGVYLQGRFEVQVLDSFGQPPRDNEVGGIYEIAAPSQNAGFPPGEWQTYDIVFHAPKTEGGKITKPGTITVDHNGVRIHEDVELTRSTRASLDSNFGQPGGLMLQDHGNPVSYRNIWLVPIKGQ